MMLFEVLFALLLIAAFIHFQLTKRKNEYETSLISEQTNSSTELKRTLAMGLYLRFRDETNDEKYLVRENSIFVKEDPISFEHFVADIFKKVRGGTTFVLPPSGDYGVDFEHTTDEGLYFGQVKCYKNDLSFEPIALVHSNMIKNGAKGGYVITTSGFSENAKKYAEGLNIELIDGISLVELWIESLNQNEQEIKKFIPEFS